MRAHLLTTTAAVALLAAVPAHAQNATWLPNPGSNNFTTATNWAPPTVPTGTAFFGATNVPSLFIDFSAPTAVGAFVLNAGSPAYTFTQQSGAATLTFNGAGIVINAGSATIRNGSTLIFNNASSAGTATIDNLVGNISFNNASSAGNATIHNMSTLSFNDASSAGNATITNEGSLRFTGSSTAGNATISTVSPVTFQDGASGGTARLITTSPASAFVFQNSVAVGSIEGAGIFQIRGPQLTTGSNNLSTTVSGAILSGGMLSGGGALVKVGTGTLTLTGDGGIFLGPTTVNGGALIVDTSFTSPLITVNSGATLGGSGTVGSTGSTIINAGGSFAPGPAGAPGAMTVTGNLAFQSGALYNVQVNPATASTTNVSGTASLAGTVNANFAPGTYSARGFTILTADGGRTGTFDSLSTPGLPTNLRASLSYPGNTAVLNVRSALGETPIAPREEPGQTPVAPPPTFTVNQLNVANAIDNFFNNGGTLPPEFFPLFSLTGSSLPNALSQLSGEVATGMQQAGFRATDLFLSVMLNPFLHGRGEAQAGGPALAFAPQPQALPQGAADAYAAILKAPAAAPATFERRWSVWGSAYGGTSRTDGDAFIGSQNTRTDVFGFAGGADYRLTPDTIVGTAIGAGQARWSLAGSLGTGNSDMVQAGVYGSHRFAGSAYISAALAYTWHDASTARTLTSPAAGQLNASFDANTWGGRIEGGYRFATALAGITPYGALEAVNIRTPAYSETGTLGAAPFALNYGSSNTTATRSELGLWFDRSTLVSPTAALTLRARAAWAHNFNDDRQLDATFQALPLASFTVTGASPAPDLALLSGAAELQLRSGWSFGLKGDAELSGSTQAFAGTGTVRYAW